MATRDSNCIVRHKASPINRLVRTSALFGRLCPLGRRGRGRGAVLVIMGAGTSHVDLRWPPDTVAD